MATKRYQTNEDIFNDIKELFVFGNYYLIVTTIAPLLALFFGNAIEDPLNITKFTLFNSTLGIVLSFLILKTCVNAFAVLFKKNFEIPFIFHDPEYSLFRGNKWISDLRILTLGMIVLGSLLVFSGVSQTSLPIQEQQILPSAQLIFDIYPASPSETGLMLVFLNVLVLLPTYFIFIRIYGSKEFRKERVFSLFAIILLIGFTVGGGFFGYALHSYRYAGSETSINTVIVFWSMSGFVTALTGSIVPAQVWHDVNNAILSAKTLYSSSVISTYILIVMLLGALAFISLVFSKLDKPFKKGYNNG